MAEAHRENDSRTCGASTIVTGQGFVRIGGQLWAVEGDKESHGEGALTASLSYLRIGGKPVIVVGDSGAADNALHPTTDAMTGAGFVRAS